MEKNIDETYIKISGKFPVQKELEIGQEITLQIKGAVVQQITGDNQDGTVSVTYVVKPLEIT